MGITKIAGASGLFSANTSWHDVSSTAENDSEAASATPPTSSGATSRSASFVLAAAAVDAVAIKIASRVTSPTGTVTVKLRNVTTSTDALTLAVNANTLPAVGTSVTPSGWIVFAFGSTVTPNGTDSYCIDIIQSVSSQVVVYSSSGNDWAREVRLSAASAAAPAVGDKLIINGEKTGATSINTWTITYDNTAATIWGASAAGNAIYVGCDGILSQQVTASTAYVLNFLGRFLVGGGGIWQFAGNAAMPSTSSLVVTAQNAANVDCGYEWGAQGNINLGGNPLTFVMTKLAADAAGSATSLTTADSTGWLNGDVIAIASTTQNKSECESKALGANASGTAIGTIAALTNAHSGTNNSNGDIRAELGNLTRNVKLQGNSATLGSYINIHALAVVTLRYVEFTKLGSATALKHGFDIATTTGTFDCQYCSIHDCTVTGSLGFNVTSASGSNITISNNVTYNIQSFHIQNVATSGVQTYNGNLCILNASTMIIFLADAGSVYTNNTAVGATSDGISISESAAIGTFSGNIGHSCVTRGITTINYPSGTISGGAAWRNNNIGLHIQTGVTIKQPLTISGMTIFGNTTRGILVSSSAVGCLITGCTIDAGVTVTQPIGIDFNPGPFSIGPLYIENTTFGVTNHHATADMSVFTVGALMVFLSNCNLASTTPLANIANLIQGTYIEAAKYQQSTGNHRMWQAEGILSIDTAIYDTTPSLRMTPAIQANSSTKMASAPLGMGFQVPVASGNTLTVTVKVRKSVVGDGTAYNGTAPRLIVRKNVAAGIAADTVLATDGGTGSTPGTAWGSGGTAELLTGTTAAVTDDAVLEFIVDLDGTTGWVNVDTWTVTGQLTSSLGTERVWFNGVPTTGFPAAGGGLMMHPGMMGRMKA
jgi:hypothetical protein